jgi:hypothetical protein
MLSVRAIFSPGRASVPSNKTGKTFSAVLASLKIPGTGSFDQCIYILAYKYTPPRAKRKTRQNKKKGIFRFNLFFGFPILNHPFLNPNRF